MNQDNQALIVQMLLSKARENSQPLYLLPSSFRGWGGHVPTQKQLLYRDSTAPPCSLFWHLPTSVIPSLSVPSASAYYPFPQFIKLPMFSCTSFKSKATLWPHMPCTLLCFLPIVGGLLKIVFTYCLHCLHFRNTQSLY